MRALVLLLLLLLLLSLGCSPPMNVPDAGGPSGCKDTSKTPANLVENPAFECDTTPAEWRALKGTLELVVGGRSGRAAKLTVDQTGGSLLYTKDLAVDAGMKKFCVSAYISGTAPFMKTVVLQTGGTMLRIEQADQLFGDFRKTPLGRGLEVPNGNATKLQLLFEIQTNRTDGQSATPGQYMLVDDVDVWETMGNCGETR
jgi:hypothetical protein